MSIRLRLNYSVSSTLAIREFFADISPPKYLVSVAYNSDLLTGFVRHPSIPDASALSISSATTAAVNTIMGMVIFACRNANAASLPPD